MRTVAGVFAHPDDETLLAGGTLAKYAAEGARVLVVTCTSGEAGDTADPSVTCVGEARREELRRACDVLGVARVELLGFRDSGLPASAAPGTLAGASVREVADRVALILREERPQVVITHDERGGYGHADHVRASAAALSAAASVGVPKLYHSVIPRSAVAAFHAALERAGLRAKWAAPSGADVDLELGVDESAVTTRVDVRAQIPVKRRALAEHRTQMKDHILLRAPEDAIRALWGEERYTLIGARPERTEVDLFEGL
ncbi:MAG TPA: PIG-L family deacetylase [Candidatus Limnocylindria bacterium]|nr:PIG-L family deacetylase [Candidatus Limnocylindria bacterium]